MDNPEDDFISSDKSINETIVRLLNETQLSSSDKEKLVNLNQIDKLIFDKEPALLDNFVSEVLAFCHERSSEIRIFVLNFISNAVRKDNEILSKVSEVICILLNDENYCVKKKCIQVLTNIYPIIFTVLSQLKKSNNDTLKQLCFFTVNLKKTILDYLQNSDNDGVRTQVIKFIECAILTQSFTSYDSEECKNESFCLDNLSKNHPFLKCYELQEESRELLSCLFTYTTSLCVSSSNLNTLLGSLTDIAKKRPYHLGKVVTTFEALHANLPPTLTKSHVITVRKGLKAKLISLVKHPSSSQYHTQITTLLIDLGASYSEVNKCIQMSKKLLLEHKKRKYSCIDFYEQYTIAKRSAACSMENDKIQKTKQPSLQKNMPFIEEELSPIHVCFNDLIPRLIIPNVTDLVLVSMMFLPEKMPSNFVSTYTPIAAAGTEPQIKHLATLIASQLVSAKLVKDRDQLAKIKYEDAKANENILDIKDEKSVYNKEAEKIAQKSIETIVGFNFNSQPNDFDKKVQVKLQNQFLLPLQETKWMPKGTFSKQPYKFEKLSKVFSSNEIESLCQSTISRIIDVDIISKSTKFVKSRNYLLSYFATVPFGCQSLKDTILDYVLEDFKNNIDLSISMLFQQYVTMMKSTDQSKHNREYNNLLIRILQAIIDKQMEYLLFKLLSQAPLLTESVFAMLKSWISPKIHVGLSLLKEMCVFRPKYSADFLKVVLELSLHPKKNIQTLALEAIFDLYPNKKFKSNIEKFALKYVDYLTLPKIPEELATLWAYENFNEWNDVFVRSCLQLFLILLPLNQKMILHLPYVYVKASDEVKRAILRLIEKPIQIMGFDSPSLYEMCRSMVKGSETLITRVVHILTSSSPSNIVPEQILSLVRDLYSSKNSDIRMLISVFHALTKEEVVNALPYIVVLSPTIIKGAFSKLYYPTSQVSPATLLIQLHMLSPEDVDMRGVIRSTGICLSNKDVYTEEVLKEVINTLLQKHPLPVLFMRTVMQALVQYPTMSPFVLQILQKLVHKEIWTQPKVWLGFIKCCERTKPASFNILLSLPCVQLHQCFSICKDLRESIMNHVDLLPKHQRIKIHKNILEIIYASEKKEQVLKDMMSIEEEGVPSSKKKKYSTSSPSEDKNQDIDTKSTDFDAIFANDTDADLTDFGGSPTYN